MRNNDGTDARKKTLFHHFPVSVIEIELQHPDSLKAFSLSLLNSKAFKKFIEYSTNYSGQIVLDN